MLEIALEKFPIRTTLKDDTPATIRIMEEGDESLFRNFHTAIPDEEQLFLRNQIRDGSLFRKWMKDPEEGEHVTLLAFVDGRIAAMGYLHQPRGGWKRHIGGVTFLTHPDFRGQGLISVLVDEIIEVARHSGLTKLESELNGERVSAIEALAFIGFSELVRLPHYIQDIQGISHDYVLMGMNLVADFEYLGAGD